jgi:hypothetical protein
MKIWYKTYQPEPTISKPIRGRYRLGTSRTIQMYKTTNCPGVIPLDQRHHNHL